MKLKKVLAIMLCSALVATGSGVSTMAGAVTEQQSMSKTEATEEETTEAETEAVEEETTEAEAEAEVTEEETSEAETEATEEGTSEAESEATEESTTEAETEAAEESTTEVETEATEEGTMESETEATEEETTEAETEATEEENTEAETEVSEAPVLMNLEMKASPSDATYVDTEEELATAVQEGGDIVVDGDIGLTQNLYINKTVTLSSENGSGIFWNGDDSYWDWDINTDEECALISLGKDADVTFENIQIDATDMGNSQDMDREYIAVFTKGGSRIEIQEGTRIINENDEAKNKSGVLVAGKGEMKGGEINGFTGSGIFVGRGGDFTLSGGEITNIKHKDGGNWGGVGLGAGGDTKEIATKVTGGSIHDCQIGIFNNGFFDMSGGEVYDVETGFVNNTRDNMSGELFYPDATFRGGKIFGILDGEDNLALLNQERGKVTIDDDFEMEGTTYNRTQGLIVINNGTITGTIINEKNGKIIINGGNISGPIINKSRARVARASQSYNSVIINNDNAELTIAGGDISSDVANGVVVSNGATGKLTMTAGKITAAGAQSVAFLNENTTVGAVKLSGGSISAAGENSKAIDNQGYTEMTKDLTVDEAGKYLVAVSGGQGGKISPTSQMAASGQVLNFTITPNSGYKISDVVVDSVSKGAVSTYQLTVSQAHSIEVTFVQKSSSGGGNGGGGGGSSRSTSTSTQSKTPETPGAWQQDQTGWKFALPTGGDYLNTWIYVKGQWYRIGLNGYMMQGWVVIDGKTYYLTPVTGEMKTGWFIDNGSYYYLDSTGAVTTGWVQVNGAWYYLNADGKMSVNTTTPDGYQVGADGKRIQ